MARYSVGPSSYGDLRGQTQFVNSPRIAAQFLSLKVDFDRLPSSLASGARLTVNEGMRSRARQMYLWTMRFVLAIVVAVPFTSRHDEVLRGNAMDIGVTMPDGTNRALTPAEFAWMHAQCELRGFTWTGRNFGEPWHIEGATRVEHFPPYPFATVDMAFAPVDQAAPPTPEPTPAPAPKIIEGNDMQLFVKSSETDVFYIITDTTTEGTGSQAKVQPYADAIPHDGPLFRTLPPSKIVVLLKGCQERRRKVGLPRDAQIDTQITKEGGTPA